jgi:hypothetical protein
LEKGRVWRENFEKMLLKREGPNETMDIFTEKGGDME